MVKTRKKQQLVKLLIIFFLCGFVFEIVAYESNII